MIPQSSPSVPNYGQTHTFVYGTGRYATCQCGLEQDLVLRDGKTVRLHRPPSGEWSESAAMCPKYITPESEGEFDYRPNRPIPEDSMAAPVMQTVASVLPEEAPPPVPRPRAEVLADLRKHNPGMFEPEIVNGCDVDQTAEQVDLEIACSPVLRHARAYVFPQSDEQAAAMVPIEVSPLGDNRYRVYYEEGPRDESAESVKVMRARYLLMRGMIARSLPSMDERTRQRWMTLYRIPWMPPVGSPLAQQVQTGQVITIKRDGNAPVDIAALFNTLSTPGAPIPEVCPTLPHDPVSV